MNIVFKINHLSFFLTLLYKVILIDYQTFNILTLSIKYNEEYNKFLNDFRQTDAYKQWTLKCNKNKQFKANWLRKKGSFFCLGSIIVFSLSIILHYQIFDPFFEHLFTI